MVFAPCGCKALREADKLADEDAAKVQRANAIEAQADWGCPFAGHDPHAELSRDCQTTLGNLERLTELPVKQARTCPRVYASTPLAISACVWRNRVKDGHPLVSLPGPLVDAIDCLGVAEGVRMQHQHDEMRREQEARQAEIEAQKNRRR